MIACGFKCSFMKVARCGICSVEDLDSFGNILFPGSGSCDWLVKVGSDLLPWNTVLVGTLTPTRYRAPTPMSYTRYTNLRGQSTPTRYS
jgi:hypothetical protein